jgi:hypothetical protein
VAAGEEQRESVIGLHRSARLDAGVERGRLAGELRDALAIPSLPAEPVDGLAAGRGHQPGARVARDAVDGPVLERAHRRVLDELLGQVPIAEDAHQRAGQPAALVAQDLGQTLVDGGAVDRHRYRLCTHRPSWTSDVPPPTDCKHSRAPMRAPLE